LGLSAALSADDFHFRFYPTLIFTRLILSTGRKVAPATAKIGS
jgi:hypothetical protein